MVDFLHGDPDQPIVMGWVFNKGIMPIYDLPANKTKAVWRTKRYGDTGQYPNAKSLDTGAPGANELRFEDKGGSEEVFLHAERDMNTRIRFQETHHVGQNQTLMVGYDRKDDVGNNETTTVGAKQTLTVTGDQEETLKANRKIDVANTDKLTVGQSHTIEVGTDLTIKANTSITIQCGPITLKMDAKSGAFSINAPQATMEGVGTAKVTSPMTTLEGTGINTVKGGMVMIN
jgi:type VI secretion system secreted protein VgrG